MSKKHRTESEIWAGRSVKKMLKISRQNKKNETGWHKARTYTKPRTCDYDFIPIGNGLYRMVKIERRNHQ